ncbi:unnamed protein product [Calypogeia fissa]
MENLPSLLPFPFPRMSRRQRNLLLACCAIGAGGYVSYRVYNSPSLTRKRLQLYRFFSSVSSLLESAAQGSDCVGVLWKDLHSFLLSNEDEVPQSLKQLFKVGQTREFQTSVSLLCKFVTQGVVGSLFEQQAPQLQDEADYGSALFEELSSRKGLRKIGKSGRDFRKERRRKELVGEAYAAKLKDAGEENSSHEYRRGKLEQGDSAFHIEGKEGQLWVREQDEDEMGRAWSGSPGGASIAETSGSGGRKKSRSPIQRREAMETSEEGLPERLVGKIFSKAGRGFAAVVVASATRSLVLSVLEGMRQMNQGDTNILGEIFLGTMGWEAKDIKDSQPREGEKDGVASEETMEKPKSAPAASDTLQDGMINFICSTKGKSLIADCIETFVGTAVSVYLDKTREINIYEDILSTVANPAHRDSVKDLLTSVCNGALETLVRTSHELLIVGSSSSAPHQSQGKESTRGLGSHRDVHRLTFSLGKGSCFNQSDNSDGCGLGECGSSEGGNDHFASGSPPPWSPESRDSESLSLAGLRGTRIAFDHSPQSEKKMPVNDLDKAEAPLLSSPSYRQINGKPVVFPTKSSDMSQGWIEGFSRTLAVPSNRSLVLDVAGTVTSEAVRSTIDVMLSKVSHTLRGKTEKGSVSDSSPGSSKVLRVISKTGELAQATASKALVAMTMCLAICLHTLLGQSVVLQHP